jgi:alcohol dehydrogenase class IV
VTFEFATAARIVFGAGASQDAPALARSLGNRAFLVAGRPRGAAADVVKRLVASGLVAARTCVTSEPDVDGVRAAVRAAAEAGCDLVVAIGGGSVIDTGKAVAALLTNGGDPFDYLEVVGAGRPLPGAAAPVLAVPTTAGSGAEVTRNAVLASPSHGVKASLRSASMLPRIALVDPRLTLDLPPALTAATGLDALAQLVEPYVSSRANPFTDAFCREGMVLVSRWLRAAVDDGTDEAARSGMSLASLLGGLALANAGLGAVHGFAGPLGGRLGAPHGALCAALLPAVVRTNLAALRDRDPDGEALVRFRHVARLLTGRREAEADEVVEWLDALRNDLAVPGLGLLGMTLDTIPGAVQQARASSSMKGNPVRLTDDELARIVSESM